MVLPSVIWTLRIENPWELFLARQLPFTFMVVLHFSARLTVWEGCAELSVGQKSWLRFRRQQMNTR